MSAVKYRQLAPILGVFALAAKASLPSGYDAYGASQYDEALAKATRENKDVILYFSLANCPPCEYVRNTLSTSTVSSAFVGRYVFIEVPVGTAEARPYRARFGINGAPHFIVLSPQGKPLCKVIGAFDNEEQALELGRHLAEIDSWPKWPEPVSKTVSPKCLSVIKSRFDSR